MALVVPAHNEAPSIESLLSALDEIDYPTGKLSIALVNDGSGDATGEAFARWAARADGRFVVDLPVPVGKVRALEAGLAALPASELVGVCDADQQPRPDCWRLLAAAFADREVGAAAGLLYPANHRDGVFARYAAVESWVHQLITSAGKDRLRLNPPTLGGGAVYRRAALADIGGFVAGISGEDVTTTVALTENGWSTRFVPAAVVDNRVIASWQDYWHQHIRWARGALDTARQHRTHSPAPLPRKLEGWLLTAGYVDRIGLVGSSLLAIRRPSLRWIPALFVAVSALEVGVALVKAGIRGPGILRYLGCVAAVFPLDAAASVAAAGSHLLRRPHAWRSPR
jgi:cellulose synthase/poly-beta-1,6-N-acetylglucosamine synthase-like glycosyltransferase